MKPTINKRCLHARRTALRDLANDIFRSYECHLEPWERVPIVGWEHQPRVAIRDEWPNGRMTCICGLDTGWIPLWDAEQRASRHQLDASRAAYSDPEKRP